MISQHIVEGYSTGRGDWPHVPHFTLHGVAVKCCRGCGRVKPLEEFVPSPGARLDWDELAQRCRSCEDTASPSKSGPREAGMQTSQLLPGVALAPAQTSGETTDKHPSGTPPAAAS